MAEDRVGDVPVDLLRMGLAVGPAGELVELGQDPGELADELLDLAGVLVDEGRGGLLGVPANQRRSGSSLTRNRAVQDYLKLEQRAIRPYSEAAPTAA
jgi:hypothetical protein